MQTQAGVLKIDLSALKSNYKQFQSMTSAHVAGVVKANAYGIGLERVVRSLLDEGCRQFFVATVGEGLALRKINFNVPVGILGGILPGAESECLHANLTPVLNSLEMVHRWAAFAKTQGQKCQAILQFCTGMNRLGLGADEIETLTADLSVLDGLDIQIVMSHFACADEKDHWLNQEQAKRFAEIAGRFPLVQKSLCNSSGLFRDKAWHYDLVRPGYALYGGNPTPETDNPVCPVVSLDVPILQIRNVKKGEVIGYGASHVFERDTQVATLAMGYADGFLRAHSGQAKLFWRGQACPVIGRVSMDVLSVDLGHLQGETPNPGDMLEVIGPHQSIDDLAQSAGTIGYEVLTSLGTRYARLYV